MEITREGLTGWLTPKGRFCKCNHKEHYILARKIIKATYLHESKMMANLYVPMGSTGGYSMSYLHVPRDDDGFLQFTIPQIKWLKKNYHKLDEEQQFMLNAYGQMSGWNPDEVE